MHKDHLSCLTRSHLIEIQTNLSFSRFQGLFILEPSLLSEVLIDISFLLTVILFQLHLVSNVFYELFFVQYHLRSRSEFDICQILSLLYRFILTFIKLIEFANIFFGKYLIILWQFSSDQLKLLTSCWVTR